MRNIIITADSNEGYTHSDRGTYLSMKDKYGGELFVPEEDGGNVTTR